MTASTALRLAAPLALALALGPLACGTAPNGVLARPVAETVLQPVVDGILAAFDTHPLVGIGDSHGLPQQTQQMELYATILRDPRFAGTVGNVVVEFGAAGRQDVIDRYVAGETVPYQELRTVWTDTVGWLPTAGQLTVAQFFAAVRGINQTLPPGDHIRVWLGEPPIDWPAVESRKDAKPAMSRRDSHPAGIIVEHILARGEKALVIYGGQHFRDATPYLLGPVPTPFMLPSLRSLVEDEYPGTFFIVLPYSELHAPGSCDQLREKASRAWPPPVLAAPARAGAPDPVLRGCATIDQADWVARGLLTLSGVKPSKVRGDAVLFLDPAADARLSPMLPDFFLEADYRREVARRFEIQHGRPLCSLPEDFSLERAAYDVDLDAPGYAELLHALFARHDLNQDGVVTRSEYTDPIPR